MMDAKKDHDIRGNTLLRTEDLRVGYEQSVVIDGITISVDAGEIVTLIGPNGAGKSTIIKSLSRQLAPLGGAAYLASESAEQAFDRLENIPQAELARTQAVVLTKMPRTEWLSVYDMVAAGRYPYTGRFGMLSEADHQVVREVMEMTDTTALASCDFNRISDGQRQRVLLARAIAQQPAMILLDEPTSFLDIRYQCDFLLLLRKMCREKKMAAVMTLHELGMAKRISDRIVCLKGGHVDRVGTPEEIFDGAYPAELFGMKEEIYREFFGCV